MQSAGRFIIVAGIALGMLSMVYFLSLVVQLPMVVTVGVVIACLALFGGWAYSHKVEMAKFPVKRELLGLVVLAIGLGLMVWQSHPLAPKHGGWDAWTFWNLHALYLADPLHWKSLFANTIADHPDYPLLVPAANAFFMRLAGAGSYVVVPYILSVSMMALVPVLIYTELVTRNMIVATVALLLLALNTFYLYSGSSQYADVPLAFFFLCALVCIDHAAESSANIALAAAALGCCIWTKNEGVILATIVIVFHAPVLFAKRNRWYFVGAMALPVLVWLCFKTFYAPPNNLVSGQSRHTLRQLFMADRYALIYQHFVQALNEKFWYVKMAFFCYAALCIIERKWPGRQMLLLLTCMAAYMMVYVFSVDYLEWHLATSIDRLMVQLMPAMLYVIALRFASNRWLTRKEDIF